MAEKKYYWLRLKDDFFSQRVIKKLRKIAGGDTYTIIYLKLQLLSLKNNGKLYFEGIEDDFSKEMALALDEDIENVSVTLTFLQKYGLIEELDNDEFSLPETVNSIGSETQVAERVRRHREKQKLLQSNDTETNCNTEKRREEKSKEDKEIENIKSKNNTKKYNSSINDYTSNEGLKETILDFVSMRIAIKKPLTDRALELLFNNLDKLTNDENVKIEILNQSIINNWKGVFPLKQKNENTSNNDNKGSFTNYDQRHYAPGELEKMLLESEGNEDDKK